MDILADLNEPQRQAVTHVDGPLLVLAGAGSGKTRVITRRVAHLVGQGVAPCSVLAITFTNKAAGEMKTRVEQLGTPRGTTVCTFHSLCVRVLREFADEAGLARNFSIYDRDDQLKVVREAMERAEAPADRLPPARILAAISRAKNGLLAVEEFAKDNTDFYGRSVARVYQQYQRLLASNHALDFDDLMMRAVLLLRDRNDILELLGRRYLYILIDEYQDTNHAQYLLAHGLAMDHENICATGDPDQSIYAWRGADVNNILEFEKDYPNAKVVRLEENYRSTAPILAAASRLIACNSLRKEKALWTRREGGSEVHVLYCDDEHAEAGAVARRIAWLHSHGADYNDVAVFYRVNSLSRLLEEKLFKSGIPYRIARGVEFYNRKEVKDVLAYLRLAVNPADDLSCVRVINTPARGIGSTTVKRLADCAAAGKRPLLEACRQGARVGLSTATAGKVVGFAQVIDSLTAEAQAKHTVKQIVEAAVRTSGLEASLADQEEEGRQARANIGELVTAAAEFDALSEGGTLADFLQQVSLVSDVDHIDGAGGGAVTLMTLHAAKGLEFPAVFIIGCEQGLLPFQRGDRLGADEMTMDRFDLEEERRLAFVGMTRAKDEVVLSCARSRMIRGQKQSQAASRFLREIGREHVVIEDQTTEAKVVRTPSRGGGFYEDVRDRQAIEATIDAAVDAQTSPALPPEYEYLREGCRVRHPQFGLGTVRRISRQQWPQTRAEIVFDDGGPKKIVLRATHLELAEES